MEWRYGRKEEGAEGRGSGRNGSMLLVLGRMKGGIMEVAAGLVRDKEADDMGGLKAWNAGKGVLLELGGMITGETMEGLVVMSVLVMTKKEIERRRQA